MLATVRVRTRLAVGFAIVLLLLVAAVGLGLSRMAQIELRLDDIVSVRHVQQTLAVAEGRRHAVLHRLQRNAQHLARHIRADVEGAVHAFGGHELAQFLGVAMARLDVQQRQRLHERTQERAQAQRIGVADGADHGLDR